MKRIQKHIEIVRTTTSGFSSMGATSCNDIVRVLSRHYARVSVRTLNEAADLDALIADKPDLVFMGLKCLPYAENTKPSNIIWVSEYLTIHGIAHIGSPARAVELERDKPHAKQRVLERGLLTPKFFVIGKDVIFDEKCLNLQFPLFIKPSNFGGSAGIDENSVIYNMAELADKVALLKKRYYADLLVEEYLPGREFSVSVLKNNSTGDYAVMPIELIAPSSVTGEKILSSRVKTLDIEVSQLIADDLVNIAVSELAIDVFHALGARDYGRIDIRLDANSEPNFIEANLVPSLKRSPGNYFPKACLLNLDIDYETMLLNIVNLGLERTLVEEQPKLQLPIAAILSPA